MVSSVTSGGGNIAQLAKQIQSGNGTQQGNPLEQAQRNRPAPPQHNTAPAPNTPAPTVNTQGQRTGSVINTTA